MMSTLTAAVPSILLLISASMPESAMKHFLRNAANVVVVLWIVFEGYRGYQRRQPHWTRASWAPFLTLAAMPFVAFAGTLAIAYGIDQHWPLMGVAESPLRMAWVLVMMVLMFGGVILLGWAQHKLTSGDPREPFTWWRRRHASNNPTA